jgi:hypothetical protein
LGSIFWGLYLSMRGAAAGRAVFGAARGFRAARGVAEPLGAVRAPRLAAAFDAVRLAAFTVVFRVDLVVVLRLAFGAVRFALAVAPDFLDLLAMLISSRPD